MGDVNKYYTIKKIARDKLLSEYHTLIILKNVLNLSEQTVSNMLNGSFVRNTTAQKVCELIGLELEDAFHTYDSMVVENDLTYKKLSEQIVNGLKSSIRKRLSVTHTKTFIDEIILIVDEIITEACYLGIEMVKHKDEQDVQEAIEQRRKK